MWDVYPAIDLRGGRVVRLKQGDPARETEYATDPASVARRWKEAGATWVHVVNLDGAFGEHSGANLTALGDIVTVGLRVQFGGGLRDLDGLRRVLGLGVSRAVIGTAAVENPELVKIGLAEFGPERIAVGIDARSGTVRTRGWQQATSVTPEDLGRTWASQGIRWSIFTDVDRDGMGSGLNVAATARLAEATGLLVIASGGVRSLDDVTQTFHANLSGIIIGRALYDGQVDLADALRVGSAGRRTHQSRPVVE
jgi:phosphoribosylformimino-5-aminoimidazole carboxamide ribotide isomerase